MTEIAVTLRCSNVQCRIETFKGMHLLPLSACPICQSPGVLQKEG